MKEETMLVTSEMMKKIEDCGFAKAKIDCLVNYLYTQQYQYALDAKSHNFKYDNRLEDCKVAITDVLGILGWCNNSNAVIIFDNHQMEMDLKKMQEKEAKEDKENE